MPAADPFEEERLRAEQIAKQARFDEPAPSQLVDRIGPVKNWADMHFAGMSAKEMRAADIERIAREKEERYKARNIRILVRGGALIVFTIVAVVAIKYLDLISLASRTSAYIFSKSATDDASTTDTGATHTPSSSSPQSTIATGPTQMDMATSKRVTWLEKDIVNATDETQNMQARVDKFTQKADELRRLVGTLTREYDAAVAQGMKFTTAETATHQQAVDTANAEFDIARGHVVDAKSTIMALQQRIDRDQVELKTIHQRYPTPMP